MRNLHDFQAKLAIFFLLALVIGVGVALPARAQDAADGAGQRASLTAGYEANQAGDRSTARTHFEEAAAGPDAELSAQANAELAYFPSHLWGDLYAEAWGWHRIEPTTSTNLVPTLRLRALYRPWLDFDAHVYLVAQGTRDVASRGTDESGGPPRILADNHLVLAAGVMLRFWEGRIGVFAQAGAAISLIDDGREPIEADIRVGAFGMAETERCRVDAGGEVSAMAELCFDGYGEVVYVSRFDHDITAVLRGRAALTYLATGPVLWQPVIEARVLMDTNGDYWNNLVDGGVAHRWRLIAPIGIDLSVGIHGGTYFGIANVDRAPSTLAYLELRLQAATYFQF